MEAEKVCDGREKVPASVGDMQGSARINVNPDKDNIKKNVSNTMVYSVESGYDDCSELRKTLTFGCISLEIHHLVCPPSDLWNQVAPLKLHVLI